VIKFFQKTIPPVRDKNRSKQLPLNCLKNSMTKPLFTATVGEKKQHKIELDKPGVFSGTIDGNTFVCDALSTGENRYSIIHENRSYEVEIVKADAETKIVTVKVNGNLYPVALKDRFDELLKSMGMDKVNNAKINELKAPMPGLVLNVLVSEGQEIKKGDPVIVLEAMKMENILKSPADVTVKKIPVKKGEAVEKNQVLVQFQ
jgi:acetyl/propionyl-CoA carboxylase alpha subunit